MDPLLELSRILTIESQQELIIKFVLENCRTTVRYYTVRYYGSLL